MNKSVEVLEKENSDLQRNLEWYKRTFEERKLTGIAKDRFINFLKGKKKKKSATKEKGSVAVGNTFVSDEDAKQYLRKNNDLLQQRFLQSQIQKFEIKTPENCKAFFQFNAETLMPAGNNIFITGWIADPEHAIKEMYCVFRNETFSKNILGNVFYYPRPDVQDHCRNFKVDVELNTGFFGFIPNLEGNVEPDAIIEIHFVTKFNELVIYKFEPTHHSLSFLNKLKLIFSVVNANQPNLFKVYDNCIGPAVAALDKLRTKPVLQPFVKNFGEQPVNPKVSIVVPLYGRYDFMQYQLSMFCNDPEFKDYEIIYVIDDPSIFNGVVLYATQIYPIYELPFRIVYSGFNLGFAGANNFGVSFATAPNLLLLNSDIIPKYKGWLSLLLDKYLELEKCGIIGPKLVFEDESIQHAGMAFDKFPFLEGFWINEHPGKGMPAWLADADQEKTMPAVTGACMLIDKALYNKIGGFDEHYILGDFEDSDLCLKLQELGYKMYYTPDVTLYHLERKSQSLFSDQGWKHKLTLYNSWRHTSKWNNLISEITAGNN